ncbi:hypothetical protein RHMOL_Rhmol10G0084700 [Rhododendron molle]|uniref:Uncharacterized protein n=1 Tax=Rhododendron molle TaxID=49168 RepID=A0ACC0M1T3_RHOML|nr:hypothetical protein RHMOL_Rhmol10G0084700 [Rhododendron molle]
MPPTYFDFIINHKGKVARLSNIDPDSIAILTCLLMIDLNSDKSLIDMFHLDGVPSTLNLFVEVESPNPCQVEHPSEVDGVDVEVVDATHDGHVYGGQRNNAPPIKAFVSYGNETKKLAPGNKAVLAPRLESMASRPVRMLPECQSGGCSSPLSETSDKKKILMKFGVKCGMIQN